MQYVICRHLIEDPDEVAPGCALDGSAEDIATFDDPAEAKAYLRGLKSTVKVTEYWLYEVSENGDRSSLDCSEMKG